MSLFFITGHGRSGTHYMGALFRHLGYDVGTQKDLADGQSHNYPHKFWPFTKARDHYEYLIQVVRDPWKVVESVYLAKYSIPLAYSDRIKDLNAGIEHETDDKLKQAVNSVVVWNERITEASPDLVVKVEEADYRCPEWLSSIGLSRETRDEAPPKTVNARKTSGWNMDDVVPWEDLSDDYAERLREHCRTYGYSEVRP